MKRKEADYPTLAQLLCTLFENYSKMSHFPNFSKLNYFWHFWKTFVHLICKRSSLRSQCWMRLFSLIFKHCVHWRSSQKTDWNFKALVHYFPIHLWPFLLDKNCCLREFYFLPEYICPAFYYDDDGIWQLCCQIVVTAELWWKGWEV